jgi:hypothetical protein
MNSLSETIIYRTKDGQTKIIDVRMENETVLAVRKDDGEMTLSRLPG